MNVLRLDIAVRDAVLVDEFESARDLEREAKLVFRIAGMAALDRLPQIFSAKEFHHHERLALIFSEIVDGEDILVAHPSRSTGFMEKTVASLLIRATVLGQDFDRHRPANDGIDGAIHVRHSSTEELLQVVFSDPAGELDHGFAIPETQLMPAK